jgi:hypothetical protein
MTASEDFGELFGGVDVEEVGAAPAGIPLGGVHRKVMNAASDKGTWTRVVMRRWGIRSTYGIKGYTIPLNRKFSVEEIKNRRFKLDVERIVSREIGGEWFTGTTDMPRDSIVELLLSEGYTQKSDDHFGIERNETYRLAN